MAQEYRLRPPGGSAAEEEVCKTVQRWSCRLGVACGNREELSDAANRNGADIVAATFHERELWPDSLDQLVASRFGSIRVQRHCNRQSQMRGEVAANEGSAFASRKDHSVTRTYAAPCKFPGDRISA